jgi:putative ABC transport system ATP-binding protein
MSLPVETASEKNQVITRIEKNQVVTGNGNIIQLSGLNKNYLTESGEYPALKDVDLRVKGGEFLAVVGKSGAGKSTMVNMITGIDDPTSGEIFVYGSPVHQMNEDQKAGWRGRNLGVVFQFFQLLPSINLLENITIPMDFSNAFPRRERKERAMHLLDQVGLVEHASKTPSKISGGQQQRVAIARALANDPQIIIADEPTGNLDSITAGEIFDLFVSLVAGGRTVMVVSHNKDIGKLASRVVEISDGRIVENGNDSSHRGSRAK